MSFLYAFKGVCKGHAGFFAVRDLESSYVFCFAGLQGFTVLGARVSGVRAGFASSSFMKALQCFYRVVLLEVL